jgi:hypothetical protein
MRAASGSILYALLNTRLIPKLRSAWLILRKYPRQKLETLLYPVVHKCYCSESIVFSILD